MSQNQAQCLANLRELESRWQKNLVAVRELIEAITPTDAPATSRRGGGSSKRKPASRKKAGKAGAEPRKSATVTRECTRCNEPKKTHQIAGIFVCDDCKAARASGPKFKIN